MENHVIPNTKQQTLANGVHQMLRRRRSSTASAALERTDLSLEMNAVQVDVPNEYPTKFAYDLENGHVNTAFANSTNSISPLRTSSSPASPNTGENSAAPSSDSEAGRANSSSAFAKFSSYWTTATRKLTRPTLLVLWTAYVIAAWRLSGWEKAKIVVIITAIIYFFVIVNHIFMPLLRWLKITAYAEVAVVYIFHRRHSRLVITVLTSAAIAAYIIVDGFGEPARFQSAIGIVVLTALGAIMSKHPRHIQWMTVIWGLLLQIILGIIVLKTEPGRWFFAFLGDCFDGLLGFTQKGIQFIFGPHPEHHMFAMQVMPIIIFLSFLISALFYTGAMNVMIHYCGLVLFHIMGTTAVESMVAAANIFLGMTEAPLVMRPFIKDVTMSELFAIVAGGFSSTSGSILGVYVTYGISAVHMLAASVMSAPASLAMSKLFYPEVQQVKHEKYERLQAATGENNDTNLLDAAFSGAMSTVKLVGYVLAGVLSAISALALFNWLLGYLGSLVLVQGLTFELIFGYILIPLAWTMGSPYSDCQQVGELIGVKTILNEFVAYERLGAMIKAGTISTRAQIIATYALSGFSNLGSMGIMIGGIAALAPSRRGDTAQIVVRALIAGSFSCFMTACVASLLISDSHHKNPTADRNATMLPHAGLPESANNMTFLNATTMRVLTSTASRN